MASAKLIFANCLRYSMLRNHTAIVPRIRHFSLSAKSLKQNEDRVLYSELHEYLNITGNRAKLGITDHAQKELGDVVYVDLPAAEEQSLVKGDVACSVESVKAVADVYMPISGKVTAVNDKLTSEPGLVNTEPYAEGWLIEVDITDSKELDTLMDEQAYNDYLLSTD